MDRPLGPKSPPGAAISPPRKVISGRHSSLVPLDSSHVSSLFAHTAGPSRSDLWTYLPLHCPTDLPTFEEHVSRWRTSTDPLYFAVMGGKDGQEALGMLAYLSIVPEHRRLELGWVLLGDALKRTKVATEAFYGMLRTAFDDLGYLRVEWKCHHLNQASKDAAKRLGFTYEGTFRQHVIMKGTRRDSAWFSIIHEEWPAIKRGFELWLSDDNFDEQGRQKRRLQECRDVQL